MAYTSREPVPELPGDEKRMRELLSAILDDIGTASPPDAAYERPDSGYRETAPVCHVVAGANGSGKTTFALCFLPRYAACLDFVNPDLIAGGLSPFDPARSAVKAGRLVLERIKELSDVRCDFGFETTLSGRGYLAWLSALKRTGYRIHLYYLWTPDCGILFSRIRQRVMSGGHFVPDEDVCRRRTRSVCLLRDYAAYADKLRVFDNSGISPVLVYEKNDGSVVHDAERFERINREVGL
jgi:predicted ABC-type ATPase